MGILSNRSKGISGLQLATLANAYGRGLQEAVDFAGSYLPAEED